MPELGYEPFRLAGLVHVRVCATGDPPRELRRMGAVHDHGGCWDNPTDVAVSGNGDIYIVDGYGSQKVSRFDKNFKHVKTIGKHTEKGAEGANAPHGTFNVCHGVWINTLKSEPEVYIADRHNDRIEVYSLHQAGYISAHDAKIAGKLGYVLAGGDLSAPTWMDEQYFLDLEREAVLSLAGEEKTQARIWYMLQNGKPLRN